MGIPNIIIDNSYKKNKDFFETWMVNNPFNAFYASTPKEVRNIINENYPHLLHTQNEKDI
jgi:exopolysaccharide biosynthesis predicted pyruvyltransferase EpsI